MDDLLTKSKGDLISEIEILKNQLNNFRKDKQKSEFRLKETQRIAKIGSWDLETKNNTLFWSDEVYQIFGVNPKVFKKTYESFLSFVHPDDKDYVDNAFAESIKKRKPYNIVHRLLMKDGSIKFVNERCVTLFDDAGNLIRSVGTIQDITEQKDTKDKTNKLSRIFEDTLNEIFLFEKESFRFIQANHAALQNLDYSIEELKELTPIDIKPGITIEAFKKIIDPLLKNEKQKIIFETVHQRKDKSLYDVEVHLQLIDFGGESLFSAIVLDITKRKINEKKINEKESKFRNLLQQSPLATLVLTPDGEICDGNQAFADLWGIKFENLIKADEKYAFLKDEQIIKMGLMPMIKKAFEGEVVNLPPIQYDAPKTMRKIGLENVKGEKRWIKARLYPLKDEKGKLTNVILTEEDYTKQIKAEKVLINYHNNLEEKVKERTKEIDIKSKKIEASQKAMRYLLEDVNEARNELSKTNKKLVEANQDLESFAYSVSHDLKSPLRAINGYTNVLLEDFPEIFVNERKEYLDLIINNSVKMNTLIDDLLRFSRAGRNKLDISEINLSVLVQDVINMLKINYREKNIITKIQEDVFLIADIAAIKQVIQNLIHNAIKFSSKDTKIEFGSKVINETKTYFIKDNGIGFDTKYTNKLFEVFQRLHSTEKYEGTGVGLALVKRIINKHGGKIWAESEIGKGSCFYFTVS